MLLGASGERFDASSLVSDLQADLLGGLQAASDALLIGLGAWLVFVPVGMCVLYPLVRVVMALVLPSAAGGGSGGGAKALEGEGKTAATEGRKSAAGAGTGAGGEICGTGGWHPAAHSASGSAGPF